MSEQLQQIKNDSAVHIESLETQLVDSAAAVSELQVGNAPHHFPNIRNFSTWRNSWDYIMLFY